MEQPNTQSQRRSRWRIGCLVHLGLFVVTGMLPSERDEWRKLYYAPSYRAELRKLAEWAVEGPEDG